jgi:hypothetical protein
MPAVVTPQRNDGRVGEAELVDRVKNLADLRICERRRCVVRLSLPTSKVVTDGVDF